MVSRSRLHDHQPIVDSPIISIHHSMRLVLLSIT